MKLNISLYWLDQSGCKEIRHPLTHERFFSARQRRDSWRTWAFFSLEIHSESHDHLSLTANAVLNLHQHGISPCILDYS